MRPGGRVQHHLGSRIDNPSSPRVMHWLVATSHTGHNLVMRWLVVGFAAFALTVPASAASVDPKLFALTQADVPRGYAFDENNSLLLSKATVDRGTNEESRLLRRLGFQGAYFGSYLNTAPPKWRFVHSGAYIFRGATGASAFVRYAKRKRLTPFTLRGIRIDLGDEAWLYPGGSAADGTAVVWRYRRVIAYVTCTEMGGHHELALALARKQQRRIVALTR
jgi:hypothetical protein